MDQKYFAVPFATSGDVTAISETIDPTGVVSFPQGWGPNYARDQTSDPLAIPIDRAQTNYLMNVITAALAALQRTGIPEWITPANNDGVALQYPMHAQVRYSATTPGVVFETYVSLVDNNVATPGTDATKWQPISDFVASAAQITAGTNNRAIVTPLGLAGAITGVSPGRLLRTSVYTMVGGVQMVSVDGGAFTATGATTFAKLAAANMWDIEITGGGGGCGGTAATTASQVALVAGGGAAAYARSVYRTMAASVAITIGAPGTAGPAGNNSGGNGGTSSFGSLITTPGGSASVGSSAVAVGVSNQSINSPGSQSAAPTGGNILNMIGISGSLALYVGSASSPFGGFGASTPLGMGGALGLSATPKVGQGFGSGAGGSAAQPSTAAGAGAAGAPGGIIIREYA